MAQIKPRITEEMQRWIDARNRFHLSHAQVQMARELGMNPRKLGKLANHDQEPWKAPYRSSSNGFIKNVLASLSLIALFPSRTEREKPLPRRPIDVNVNSAPIFSAIR